MVSALANYFRASFPAVSIQTVDEERARLAVMGAAREAGKKVVVTWSAAEGAVSYDLSRGGMPPKVQVQNTHPLVNMCILKHGDAVFVLLDVQTWPLDRDPVTLRALRDFIAAGPARGSTVVFLGNGFTPHPSVAHLVATLEHDLPGPEDLQKIADQMAKDEDLPRPVSSDVVMAMSGLTGSEAENALGLSFVETGGFDPKVIYREKTAVVRRSGLLELVAPDPMGMANVGGLDVLKEWVRRRKRVWSKDAEKYGLAKPKGLLLVGVQGAGKSLAAKAIGTELGVPTLRLDCGALFNMYIGESERQTREVLKLAEAVSPCVLWADELEKGMAGMQGRQGDGGAARRVFATILTWMQERKRSVFFVATANQVQDLPAELLRRGRFDEIFTVDLPSLADRKAIFEIHVRARKRKPAAFDLQALAEISHGHTGAEIESAIDDGMFRAFDRGAEVTTDDIAAAVADTVPLSVTASEQVAAIRAWGSARGRAASSSRFEADPKAGD